MRRLLLLRHAKAERAQPGERDQDRVLAVRGRADAKKLGAYLVRHAFVPDRAVVSTAARTRETWTQVAQAFAAPPPVDFDERIYDAAPQAILETIKETDPQTGTLIMIGHNPGIQELASMLVATGEIDARERLGEGFPTSALALITFALADWSNLRARAGRLEHFITPQWLETAD